LVEADSKQIRSNRSDADGGVGRDGQHDRGAALSRPWLARDVDARRYGILARVTKT